MPIPADIPKQKDKENRRVYLSAKNLVICDSEVRYAYGLGENISERNELDVKVFVCTDLNYVRRFQKSKEIHILNR